ncbi:HlyD family secretion protein [Aequorivita echinoideorum]|uniref:HlyD family efflux transporter periplasmic adaptor subunit n=1 Tax=Aequorivita echinoideorum TaxID=1549647 RepID=A0ABS5S1X8_9FLAO|nr:HlyD family efflux transporter periplasmic adaptor subunit [Aequorivita echinoideorum]MBT0607217.1 HlyD family efflux transporter periplasmic adaptor subunit [Aequorivita echinoideorum]
MLNIAKESIHRFVDLSKYNAAKRVSRPNHYKYFNRFLLVFMLIAIIVLFLPWTQNVSGNGYVTTLTPGQRPQTIQSPIPGRIEEWYVNEGDFVKKGDTILHISEIVNQYQDPYLVERTIEQQEAKSRSASSYSNKIIALENRINALGQERNLKLSQGENMVRQLEFTIISDSTDLIAMRNNLEIAQRQYERFRQLNEEGLKSLSDVEAKRLKQQELLAKVVSQENKLLTSKNRLSNAITELNRIKAEYSDKISSAQSDIASAASSQFEAEAEVSKLANQSTNYSIRQSFYYVTAPQSGYINKALRSGLGETFNEGEQLVGIMPANYDLAVEAYVDPLNLPLLHTGENVRLQFDGWPAIFFSGWPNASYGTYGGKIVVVETFRSPNGKFRILIAPNESEKEWPDRLRVGSGAYMIALLEDVPIWYEIWRKLNGFPPNYYQPANSGDPSILDGSTKSMKPKNSK